MPQRLTVKDAQRLIAREYGLAVDARTVRRWIVRGELRDALTDPARPTTSPERVREVFSGQRRERRKTEGND